MKKQEKVIVFPKQKEDHNKSIIEFIEMDHVRLSIDKIAISLGFKKGWHKQHFWGHSQFYFGRDTIKLYIKDIKDKALTARVAALAQIEYPEYKFYSVAFGSQIIVYLKGQKRWTK